MKKTVPTQLFTGDCESKDVSFVGTASDVFPDPGLRNPSYFSTDRAALVSRVLHADATANGLDASDPGYDDNLRAVIEGEAPFGQRCEVDRKMLIITPIRVTLSIIGGRI